MATAKSTDPWIFLKPAAQRVPPQKIKHGRHNTPEHRVWCEMKRRCSNRKLHNYHRYGGRGIKVCDRWLNSFVNFFADMGERPTPDHQIERKDTDGDYTPDNCRWATRLEQARNKSNNTFVTINGETLTLGAWHEKLGTSPGVMEGRARKNGTTAAEELVKAVAAGDYATGRRRLTADLVNQVKGGLANMESVRSISARLGISRAVVGQIRDGKRKDGYRV